MTWVSLDDRFPKHHKVVDLSDRAFRVYVLGLCHSAENLTDGHLSPRDLRVISAVLDGRPINRTVGELVTAGLWDQNGNGFVIHDYLEHQFSRSEVEAKREHIRQVRSEAGRKGGVKSGESRRAKQKERQT